VSVAERYRELESGLPDDWTNARFVLTVDELSRAERAASLLSPFAPGRVGRQVRFSVPRRGGRRDQARRLLARIDREGIAGTLEVATATQAAPPAAPEAEPRIAWAPAADQWDAAVVTLPEDWSDIFAQVELGSSDFLEPAALLLGPLNPSRYGSAVGFRFRVARSYGYGASPEMTRRCLERLDEEGIAARVAILRFLADTKHVLTQGPVWYLDGKPV
jgi:hypothetical protein